MSRSDKIRRRVKTMEGVFSAHEVSVASGEEAKFVRGVMNRMTAAGELTREGRGQYQNQNVTAAARRATRRASRRAPARVRANGARTSTATTPGVSVAIGGTVAMTIVEARAQRDGSVEVTLSDGNGLKATAVYQGGLKARRTRAEAAA